MRAAKGCKRIESARCRKRLIADLRRQVESATKFHRQDSAAGVCRVALPYSFGQEIVPAAESSLAWYWLFPGHKLSVPETKQVGRHHVDAIEFQEVAASCGGAGENPETGDSALPAAFILRLIR